jgi:ubiquinone/menaquinone biosynthesis C-methylase UbiE
MRSGSVAKWRSRRRPGRLVRAGKRVQGKHLSELDWWKRELSRYVAWYEGKHDLYGVPPPPAAARTGLALEVSACMTFLAQTRDRYLTDLKIGSRHFAGKTLLDLGCGPLPWSVAFEDCRIVGIDPLIAAYEEAGFPLSEFTDRITFVRGFAEDMPFPASSFDAVIAVNSIDHVDDFARSTEEIKRVLKPGGVLRMEVHYHPPTRLEPQVLDDQAVLAHLGELGMAKVSEAIPEGVYRHSDDPRERIVIWANDEAT